MKNIRATLEVTFPMDLLSAHAVSIWAEAQADDIVSEGSGAVVSINVREVEDPDPCEPLPAPELRPDVPLSTGELAGLRSVFRIFQKAVHQNATAHGFWPTLRTVETWLSKIALIHSEASELTEAVRKGDPRRPCVKVPQITVEAEELADLVIRAMDYAEARKIDLMQAIFLKHAFNQTRPFKHGKNA